MSGQCPGIDICEDPVELTQALCNIESVSGNETLLVDALQQALQRADHLQVQRDGNALVASTHLGLPHRVVLAGHVDTVPVADNLPVKISGPDADPILFGRGTVDMKSGLAAILSTVVTVTEPSWDITYVVYDNEEVDNRLNGLGRLIRNHPDWVSGDFAVLGEPTKATVAGGCNGSLHVEVSVSGIAAHSARPWMGRNAIHAAADVLNRLREYQPRQVHVEGLVYRESLNAVGMRSGIAGNVIPDKCIVHVNYRFAPDRTVAQAFEHVQELFDGYHSEITDASPSARPGLDHPLAQEFIAAVGSRATAKDAWTDVARLSELGIPAVNYGPGDPSLAHRDDERCGAQQIRKCATALQQWLTR